MNPVHPVQTITLALATLVSLALLSPVKAQDGIPDRISELHEWISLDAPPGREHLATDKILLAMRGWKRDALGNLMLRKGSGQPRRVVACALDRPAFAVTEITDDGYLRLREIGAGRQHPLWVQFHEGQQIRVLTRGGPVDGVIIVKSTHLQRGRAAAPTTTLDDLWVDVGATSKVEVRGLGIEMLDPVVRASRAWFLGDFVSGHLASVRAGCAAIADASQGKISKGETIFLFTTLRSFGHDGLEAALRSLGRVDEITLLEQSGENASSSEPYSERRIDKPPYLPESTGLTSLTILAPRVRFSGSLVESVQLADFEKLLLAVERAAGVENETTFHRTGFVAKTFQFSSEDTTANLLKSLAEIPSVSGHERPVR
ncbi:MAG TPA: hypothetical protein VM656_17205, partial [Pyrinomonadaceae bacterium]|nr:hypothetical protein [Pyrinomonadaceae bacterium]